MPALSRRSCQWGVVILTTEFTKEDIATSSSIFSPRNGSLADRDKAMTDKNEEVFFQDWKPGKGHQEICVWVNKDPDGNFWIAIVTRDGRYPRWETSRGAIVRTLSEAFATLNVWLGERDCGWNIETEEEVE